jgi:hypothetical protein
LNQFKHIHLSSKKAPTSPYWTACPINNVLYPLDLPLSPKAIPNSRAVAIIIIIGGYPTSLVVAHNAANFAALDNQEAGEVAGEALLNPRTRNAKV